MFKLAVRPTLASESNEIKADKKYMVVRRVENWSSSVKARDY